MPSTASEPTIRRARPDDAAELAELFWRVREQSVPAIPMIAHPRETVLPFVRDVLLPGFEVYVAVLDGRMVGFLALMAPDHLGHLYLDRPHTGRGLGSRFVEVAKERFPEGLRLWAFQDNQDALRFYRRHGFVAVQWTDGDNEEGAPDVLMTWSPSMPEGTRTLVGHAAASATQDGRPVEVDRAAEAVSVGGPARAGATTELVVGTEPDGEGQT